MSDKSVTGFKINITEYNNRYHGEYEQTDPQISFNQYHYKEENFFMNIVTGDKSWFSFTT